MAYEIPDNEPAQIRAGDTIQWRRSLPDYPADQGWVLSYRFINATAQFDITASADGSAHLVDVAIGDSADYVAGDYSWVSAVSKDGERHTIESGQMKVLPDLMAVASGGLDIRSTAKKTLALVDAAMLAHGSKAWTQQYSIAGRTMTFRSPADFMAFRSQLQREVRAEENQERINNGLAPKNKILVRL